MSDEIKYAYLKSHPMFANTSEQKIKEACNLVKIKTVFRGETLNYGAGDYSKIYLLIKGKIKITLSQHRPLPICTPMCFAARRRALSP